jgi:transcriptional regulator with XRE-family HTH domain
MAVISAQLSRRTVPRSLTLVNTLVPVSTEPQDTPGQRLREFIDARWTRKQGGIRGLAKKLTVSTETVYEWFRDERPPSLDHLARLAEALGTTRVAILAAMDGDVPYLPLNDATERLMRRVAEQVLDERLGRR